MFFLFFIKLKLKDLQICYEPICYSQQNLLSLNWEILHFYPIKGLNVIHF